MRGVTIRAGGLAVAAVLAFTATASAATLRVTRADDPIPGACTNQDCSLREAVREANSTAGPDKIVLKATDYQLTRPGGDDTATAGDLDITGSGRLTIAGKGAGKTAIDGNDVDRILDVLPGAALSVSAATLRDGNTLDSGGAIQNQGSTSLQRSALRSNLAGDEGGGVHNAGASRLIASRSRLIGNDAGSRGGAVNSTDTARIRLQRVVVAGNEADRGAGLQNWNEATLTIRNSTIRGNSSPNDGGGLVNQNFGETRIKNSTISGNTASDDGGGIFIQNDALLVLTNTTWSGNRAAEGGAIYANNWPYIRINFSTIAKNSATVTGGAIFDQTSGNNLLRPPPFWLLRGTIVANNSSPGVDNCALHEDSAPSHFDSQGSNLEDENSCFFTRGSDQRNANARLRRLAKNGGTTKTHALKPSSDAVDAAKKKGCPGRDQRGVKRPQGNRCDVGSYELKQR